jgi:hypothetical protein
MDPNAFRGCKFTAMGSHRHHPVATLLALCTALCAFAPARAQQDAVNFAVFGDCRPGDEYYSTALRKLAADMAMQRPAFLLGTGDYIQGASTEQKVRWQWQGFFVGIAPLQALGQVPVALAPGNHDIGGSLTNQRIFEEYFDGRYYSFDRGSYHMILLDTEEPGLQGRITGRQLEWLKQDLAASRGAALTFVTLHRPLYPVGVHRGDSLDSRPAERDALHRLFVQEGVDCVFAGHEHLFNRQRKDNIDYIITAGGGAPLYAEASRGGYYHYVLVMATGSTYRLQVRKL